MAIDTTTSVDVQSLTPFKKFIMTIGALPTSYLESMSYAELLMWFCNYLQNTVIPTVNNNAEAVEELQGLYEDLRTYVNEYFDNLDVQEEINIKLDQMANNGTLTNLIKDYVDPIYQAYETEIDNTITTQNQNIATLEGRMDEFTTLTEGSTTGDAELADIRVAWDGTTYANAGNAVRGQVKNLNDKFPVGEYDTQFFTLDNSDQANVLDMRALVKGYCLGSPGSISTIPQINANYCYTDFLPIPINGKLAFTRLNDDGTERTYGGISGGVLLFNKDKEYVSGTWGAYFIQAPDGNQQYYAKFTFNFTTYGEKEPMIECFTNKYLPPTQQEYVDVEYTFNYGAGVTNYEENVAFDIPSTIYATVGHEMSLVYYNIIKCSNINDYQITCSTNNAQIENLSDRLRINPTSAGTTTVTLYVKKNGKTVISKTINIVASADSQNAIKAIFLGDSMTNAGYFLSELKRMMGDNLTLYGTRTSSAPDSTDASRQVNHEGRPGWSTSNYINNASVGTVTNPFYNNGFDFSYYMTNNPLFNDVTDVFIQLGTNDGAGTNFEVRYKTICDSIKAYNADIRIHCLLPIPPIKSGYGYGTRNYIDYMTFKDFMFNSCNKIITLYQGASGYSLIPTNANIDCWYDFPRTEVPANSRNPELIEVGNDNVHPNRYGYYRFSDVIYNDIIVNS